ncbi:Crp/Fnr family transcriptional regulator [Comamonas aquatica]|uniref:Crp/Fnr family transcriptional regulator n=1 Tax=Comamonas aquatica TaxID=225991 RepID=UPI0009F5E74C|nr:Crp/Fnr family transcriptional regulator [Comamonas aquatica]
MPVVASALTVLPLLSHLPQVTIAHLAQHAQVHSYAKREVVLHKGASGQCLNFLLDGRLQGLDFTADAREVGLYFVQPGDFFGEVAVVDNLPQPEYVTALMRSQVISISKELIRPVLFAVPQLAEALCMRLSQRLRSVSEHRRILGLATPVQRVCALLTQMDTQGRIPQVPTHQELAIMLSLTRETVSRVFQLLQGRSIVERDGNDLLVLMRPQLAALAEGAEVG